MYHIENNIIQLSLQSPYIKPCYDLCGFCFLWTLPDKFFWQMYCLSPIFLPFEHFSILIIKAFILFLLIGHSHVIPKDNSYSFGVTYETMADTG